MPTIEIRNVPDSVYRELQMRAAAAGQSLSDFSLAHLQRGVARPLVRDVLRRARLRPGGAPAGAAAAAVRTGRNRA